MLRIGRSLIIIIMNVRGLKASFYFSTCIFSVIVCICVVSYILVCVMPTARYTILGRPGR